MCIYEIRKIHSNEVTEALALALEVFLQFEAPDYKPEVIDTFKRDIVENVEFISKCQQGVCPIYAAFDKGEMIGIIGMRSNRTHINLVFTKKEYHRRGVVDENTIFFYAGSTWVEDENRSRYKVFVEFEEGTEDEEGTIKGKLRLYGDEGEPGINIRPLGECKYEKRIIMRGGTARENQSPYSSEGAST